MCGACRGRQYCGRQVLVRMYHRLPQGSVCRQLGTCTFIRLPRTPVPARCHPHLQLREGREKGLICTWGWERIEPLPSSMAERCTVELIAAPRWDFVHQGGHINEAVWMTDVTHSRAVMSWQSRVRGYLHCENKVKSCGVLVSQNRGDQLARIHRSTACKSQSGT